MDLESFVMTLFLMLIALVLIGALIGVISLFISCGLDIFRDYSTNQQRNKR